MIKPANANEVEQALDLAKKLRCRIDPVVKKHLETGHAECIVYTTTQGNVIGYAICRSAGECEILSIGVDASYRRLGVGSELLWWIKGLRENGAVRARVPATNKVARLFFRSHWFDGVGEDMRYRPRSTPMTRLVRERRRS